jgi:hypothetical protein
MTRTNPLRRTAAAAAVVGVTTFGAVALASPALAGTTPAASAQVSSAGYEVALPVIPGLTVATIMSSAHAAPPLTIQSPLPAGRVAFVIGMITLPPVPAQPAQAIQTVAGNLYAQQGYQVSFDMHGLLIVGQKVCDPRKPAGKQKDCVPADAPRF